MNNNEGHEESAIVLAEKLTDGGLIHVISSWSLDDIFNPLLYKTKIEKIPDTFKSVGEYMKCFINPLLEETRSHLCSSMDPISKAPFSQIISCKEIQPFGRGLYEIEIKEQGWENDDQTKRALIPGDIFILSDVKAKVVSDLQRNGKIWGFASYCPPKEDDDHDKTAFTCFTVKIWKEDFEMKKPMFVMYLVNILPNRRIWNALHMNSNSQILKEVLLTNSQVKKGGDCNICRAQRSESLITSNSDTDLLLSGLNESQVKAILSSLNNTNCNHKSSIELIWGPPGTGKTKTVSVLLFKLFTNNCRTLACAPTNTAIMQLASRFLLLLKDFHGNDSRVICSLGDILLFGNKSRLKVGFEDRYIHLDYRVDRLVECFSPLTGWRNRFDSVIDFLQHCVSQYHIFLENEKKGECDMKIIGKSLDCRRRIKGLEVVQKSFLEFVRNKFKIIASSLKDCIAILCTHIPEKVLKVSFQRMSCLLSLIDSLETLLFQNWVVSKELENLFSFPTHVQNPSKLSDNLECLSKKRIDCILVLKSLKESLSLLNLPKIEHKGTIADFCFQNASLFFCTVSGSFKLYSMSLEPLKALVIDEAAMLKECESVIPLQIREIKHAILIGDECQLPAMVESKVSDEAGFGRSLFERLSSSGHPKHLLNVQYRMQPSISRFPNSKFYSGQILDGPNVLSEHYGSKYLPGRMFGSYSFINIKDGIEDKDGIGHSWRNVVEVAVVLKIVQSLYKACVHSKEKINIGVISPYSAQVAAIQKKIGKNYTNCDNFTVKVSSVDGFQGGEEDVIIISTVRSNRGSSIGFLSCNQRTNVALTRARYGLWILGNYNTLSKSDSVWKDLVVDAKNRDCFFDAEEDKELADAIRESIKDFDQFDDLLKGDGILFKNARWKVFFSEFFIDSFKNLSSFRTKKSVMDLLSRLSSGWMPKRSGTELICGRSSQIVKQFSVENLFVIWAIDVIKESGYVQVLRIWDILPMEDIPRLVKHLDGIYGAYTDDFISLCEEKCRKGNLVVPKTWGSSSEIVPFKYLPVNAMKDVENVCTGTVAARSCEPDKTVGLSLLSDFALPSDIESKADFNGRDQPEIVDYLHAFEALNIEVDKKDHSSLLSNTSNFKMDLVKCIEVLTTVKATNNQKNLKHEHEPLLQELDNMLDDLNRLLSALNMSDSYQNLSQLSKSVHSRKTKFVPILWELLGKDKTTAVDKALVPCTVDENQEDNQEDGNGEAKDTNTMEAAKTTETALTAFNSQRILRYMLLPIWKIVTFIHRLASRVED